MAGSRASRRARFCWRRPSCARVPSSCISTRRSTARPTGATSAISWWQSSAARACSTRCTAGSSTISPAAARSSPLSCARASASPTRWSCSRARSSRLSARGFPGRRWRSCPTASIAPPIRATTVPRPIRPHRCGSSTSAGSPPRRACSRRSRRCALRAPAASRRDWCSRAAAPRSRGFASTRAMRPSRATWRSSARRTARTRRSSSRRPMCWCWRATAKGCRTRCSKRWRRASCRSSRRWAPSPTW